MNRWAYILAGAAFQALAMVGCATTAYHFYGLSLPPSCFDQGTLLGDPGAKGWPNLPFDECKPDATPNGKGKCVYELYQDWENKDVALSECESDLNACQHGRTTMRGGGSEGVQTAWVKP
jgi:hypothetical protein